MSVSVCSPNIPANLPSQWKKVEEGEFAAFFQRDDGLQVISSIDHHMLKHVSFSRGKDVPFLEHDVRDVRAVFFDVKDMVVKGFPAEVEALRLDKGWVIHLFSRVDSQPITEWGEPV